MKFRVEPNGEETDAQGVQEFMLRSDLMTIAASLAMAFATFYLIGAIVVDLIGPLISIIVGGPHSDQRRVEVDLAGQEPSVIRG